MNSKRIRLLTGIPFATAVLGIGIGVALPHPATTATVTRNVQVTPAACYDALDKAERVISDAQRAFQIIGASVGGSAATIVAATGELNALATTISSDRAAYDAAASRCRAS